MYSTYRIKRRKREEKDKVSGVLNSAEITKPEKIEQRKDLKLIEPCTLENKCCP